MNEGKESKPLEDQGMYTRFPHTLEDQGFTYLGGPRVHNRKHDHNSKHVMYWVFPE